MCLMYSSDVEYSRRRAVYWRKLKNVTKTHFGQKKRTMQYAFHAMNQVIRSPNFIPPNRKPSYSPSYSQRELKKKKKDARDRRFRNVSAIKSRRIDKNPFYFYEPDGRRWTFKFVCTQTGMCCAGSV